MGRKAIIQGDFHASNKDAKKLLSRDTTATDAIFIEGRGDNIHLQRSAAYLLWLIGYLSLEIIYTTSNWIRETLFNDHWEIRGAAISRGLAVEDEIDAELNEVWNLIHETARRQFYYLALLLMLFTLIWPFFGDPVLGIPAGFIAVILAWLIPIGYSAGVIFRLSSDGVRDEIMSNSISEISENEDYQEVLVLCGQEHVDGISNRLEEEGWEVHSYDSVHPLSDLW